MSPKRRKKLPLLKRLLSARGRSLDITRAGWLFIVLTLAVGFAAINSGSNLMHAIFGAQMALIVGSGLLSERTVRRAQATRLPGPTLHAGTPAPVRVEIKNVHPRTDLLSVSVEDDERYEGEGKCEPVFAVRLPAAGSVELTTTVTMPRRGQHTLPPAVVSTRFPFGLFVKRRELATPRTVTIYPKVRPVPLHGGLRHRPGAGEASGRRARVGEFFGLREYREGDDPRRIYWPASARGRDPVVREHEALGDTEVILELAAGTTGDAAFEDEVEQVASLAVAHLREPGVAVGLVYGGDVVITPTSGAHGRRELLEYLALVGAAA